MSQTVDENQTKTWSVLITARAFWTSGQAAQKALGSAGCRVVQTPNPGPLPEEELIQRLQGCDAVIASSDPYRAAVFAACPQLKIVSRCGVGIDSIDLEAATEAGVVVANAPGTMTEAVADYAFGLLLAVARKIVDGDRLMHSGGWAEFPGPLVYGKTLGLAGFGQIGQGVARRAQGFRMRILAYDPPMAAKAQENALPPDLPPIEFTDLDTLLATSDFVSVHVPSLPETKGLFNLARFQQMKRSAYIINTARGALIDEAGLITALSEGSIAGAALDVYSAEPLPSDHPLRHAPNCLITPHNAFNAFEAAEAMNRVSGENILNLLKGERPAFVCNPRVWDSPALRVKPL